MYQTNHAEIVAWTLLYPSTFLLPVVWHLSPTVSLFAYVHRLHNVVHLFPVKVFWNNTKIPFAYRVQSCFTLTEVSSTLLLLFKFANHRNKRPFVSKANEDLVSTLLTIGEVNDIFPIWCSSALYNYAGRSRSRFGNNICFILLSDSLRHRTCYLFLYKAIVIRVASN